MSWPEYDDPEFADVQRQHIEQMAAELEWNMMLSPDDHCPTHRRALTPREIKAGVCFWCCPERYPSKSAASKPSGDDAEDAPEALF